jgi:drug/metabolite transporter (DMT)-like permease
MRGLAALALAAFASSLYAGSTSLQALVARAEPHESALRATLLGRLLRRRVWLAATGAGLVGWVLQALALSLASIALVQPALGLGLIILLVFGVRLLHESVGPREIGGAAVIIGAVAVLAWAAPHAATSFSAAGTWAVGISVVVVAAAPMLLRATRRVGGLATSVTAGLGWGCVGLATALAVDAVHDHRVLVTAAWMAAVVAASWGTLLSEMTALQLWPATRAVPISFGLEMAAPAGAAPLIAHGSPPHPVAFGLALVAACAGAALLGGSRTVAKPLTAP